MDAQEVVKRAEAILGRPLPPRESPEFLKAVAEISEKDPVLAKALVAAAKRRSPEEEKEAERVKRQVEGQVKAAERRAQLRDKLKALRERFLLQRALVAGAEVKAPRKPVLLLLGALALGGVLFFVWNSINTPSKEVQAVGLPIATASQTDPEVEKKAEEALGGKLPESGEERLNAIKELSQKDPRLAAEVALGEPLSEDPAEREEQLKRLEKIDPELAKALKAALAEEERKAKAQEAAKALVGESESGVQPPPEGLPPTAANGQAPPPPGPTTPPPPVPPPPTAGGGSGQEVQNPNVLAERPAPQPTMRESGASSGQGGGSGGEGEGSGQSSSGNRLRPVGFFLAEAPRTEAKTTAGSASTEAAVRERTFLVAEATRTGGAPAGPGGGFPEGRAQGGAGFAAEREPSKPLVVSREEGQGQGRKGFSVLAEAPSQPEKGAPGVGSPTALPEPTRAFTDPFVKGNDSSSTLPGPAQSFADGSVKPSSGSPQAQGASAPVREENPLPYAPGSFVTARLQVQVAVVEGGTSPIVLEGADGGIWVGTARLNALGRVEVELDTLYLRGKAYKVRAMVYDADRQLGIQARVEEKAPSLAQDILRASASALGQYVDLLSKQTTTTQLPGGGVAQSQQAPPLEMVVLGSIGRLFSLPENRKSLVRVAQVPPGKVVQVMVLGG